MKKTILLLLAFIPSLAAAQEARPLTMHEAVALALKHSKSLHISGMRVEAAEAKSGEASAADMPSVKLQAGYTRLSDVDPFQIQPPGSPAPITVSPVISNAYSLKLAVIHPLYTGQRLEKTARSAEFSAQAAGHDHSRDEADLVFTVKGAYWTLYKAMKVKDVLDENVQQVEAHLGDVTNMVNAGIMLRDEQLKVQVQLSNARFARSDAANNVRLSMMTLNNAIGLPLESMVNPVSELQPEDRPLKPLDAYTSSAMENREDVKAAQSRLDAADASAEAAKGGYYPQVALFGDYYYQRPNQRVLPNRDQFDGTWDVGISLSYDLWDWGTVKYQAKQAEAVRSQSGIALDLLRDSVLLEVNQSFLSLSQAKERIAIAQQGVAQADESHRITKNRFASGQATNTEVLDAELALLQAKLNLTVAVADCEVASARMDRAAGAK
ncbi:MAG: TolC family protein [Nitrospinae bacterium]|nr:TolC family protein [Nitrospinota bacterium]